ncbi:MAG: capsular polysaccharide transport system permease protein [Granulosicoccus sp.]|jgi:capsular polysaccharide transport system permease protein
MKAILKTLGTIVGVPTLFAIIYYGFMASDMYVSEAKVAVRSAKSGLSTNGLTALLSSPVLSSGGQDSMVVMDYVSSLDIVDKLRDRADFIQHYSSENIDYVSRLKNDATRQEILRYYLKRVNVQRDMMSDVLTVKVRAFSPEMAQQIASLIIELNEELVNTLSNRMEEDAIRSARTEVDRAVTHLRKTALDINHFQSVNDSISPQDESIALFGRLSVMESRLSETRATLSETLAYMREDSADVVVLKNRINALERQLSLEKGRVTGEGKDDLGRLVGNYQPLILEQEIAQQGYASSLASFEAARIDAQRKKQYLITFVEPNLPDAASEPRRFVKIVTVMVYSFLAYLIFGLLWSALKDHMSH